MKTSTAVVVVGVLALGVLAVALLRQNPGGGVPPSATSATGNTLQKSPTQWAAPPKTDRPSTAETILHDGASIASTFFGPQGFFR